MEYTEEGVRLMQCTQLVHPFHPQCSMATWMVWKDAFLFGSKVYFPLHVFPAILQGKGIQYMVRNTLPNVISSCAFLGTLASFTLPAICFQRSVFGCNHPIQVFVGGTFSGLVSIFLERTSRRHELALFCLNQVSESLWRMFHYRGYLPSIEYGDVYIFSATCAALSYFYYKDSRQLNPSLFRGIEVMLGDTKLDDEGKKTPKKLLQCIELITRSFLRGFSIGCGIKTALSLISNLAVKRTSEAVKQLFGKGNLNFGIFLGLFVSSWKGIPALLQLFTKSDDSLHAILAGAIAGLAIFFSRSVELTMYFYSKAIDALLNALLSRARLEPLKYGDILFFSLSCGLLFYCSILEPYNLRPSYWRFLYAASVGRYGLFEVIARGYKPELFEVSGFKY